MNKSYWLNAEKARAAITDDAEVAIKAKIRAKFKKIVESLIDSFDAVYHEAAALNAKRTPVSLAQLYQLDSYATLQAKLINELRNLGVSETAILEKELRKEWATIYKMTEVPDVDKPATFGASAVQQVSDIWCADGKTIAGRIDTHVSHLMDALNDNFSYYIQKGKSLSFIKEKLMESFNMSYREAEMVARTETARIQTQAAAQRYKEYGISKYQVIVKEDEKLCPICGKKDGEIFDSDNLQLGINAPPFHPRCRCAIIPFVKISQTKETKTL